MKEGNTRKFEGTATLGLISSKATIEGPIVKDKGSFMISGRRTYLDILTKALGKVNDSIPEIPYYFYDLNMKANYAINSKNRIYVSGYFGRDDLKLSAAEGTDIGMNWGNYTGTVRWNSLITNKLFSNVTLITSHYDYEIDQKLTLGRDDREFSFSWDAFLKDYAIKADFGYYLNSDNTIKFGVNTTYHDFNIGEVKGKSDSTKFDFKIPMVHSLEHAMYLGNDQKLSPKISLSYGVRFSIFQNIGKATVYDLDDSYEVIDTSYHKKGKIYNTYANGFEPRLGFTYILSNKNSIKLGYSRSKQYMQTASNSISGTPLDVWIPSSEQIKPQTSDQYSLGYFHNFLDNAIQTSVEVYYKDMKDQVDFKDFADPVLNPKIESELRFGIARAYGVEFLLQKQEGKITGWISYTYSRSERKINDIQEKDWFLSPYDTPHDISLVLTYDITERLSVSTNWVYQTGKPFTAPEARVTVPVVSANNPRDEGLVLPYYGGRNNDRLPDYHRLDLGVQWKSRKWKDNKRGILSVSFYNVYRRSNASAIVFEPDDDNPIKTKAYRSSIFPDMIPSFSYTFNF
jgi:outer membrane receptor for ferrienterochelin and colicin